MNPKVDGYFQRSEKWRDELEKLREILLDSGLTEELKWGKPCYTHRKGNVVILLPLKEYCAMLLPKGALLADPDGILVTPTENTQAARRIHFTNAREITAKKAVLKAYIQAAVDMEESGLKVEYKETAEFPVPEELQRKLAEDEPYRKAWEALTPGRQRGYLLHFSEPKQSITREARIGKRRAAILEGKGMHDR